MQQAQTLIDKAAEMCGSRYKLAQRLDENQSFLSKVANGSRQTPPGLAARLAKLAGMDPRAAACAAVLVQEPDPAKRAELAELFGLPVDGPAWLHSKASPP